MKICHLLLDEGTVRSAEAVRRDLKDGDVLVAAPGRVLRDRFEAVLSRQLRERSDAYGDLSELVEGLKRLAPASFGREADAARERIYSLLCQGMSLSFRDSSLTDYLEAMFVQLCGQCVAAMLEAEAFSDGREIIICERNRGLPVIDWVLSEKQIVALPAASGLTVVAGAYGRKVTGETVNLGAGGSELTATLIASALKGACVRFYVTGFNYTESARLTYEEAAQRFPSGDPVFPPALLPVKQAGIPAEIASLDADGAIVVTISAVSEGSVSKGITGVVCSGPMTLVTVYGSGLLGSVGISSVLFGTLAKEGLNIHFISQSLAEYSISFAVKRADAPRAEAALKAMIAETGHSDFAELSYTSVPVEIISVFGQGMRHVPGISGRVYSALGDAGINVIASSQGGEELAISIVVAEPDANRAQEVLMKIR